MIISITPVLTECNVSCAVPESFVRGNPKGHHRPANKHHLNGVSLAGHKGPILNAGLVAL